MTSTTTTTILPLLISRIDPESGTAGDIINVDGQGFSPIAGNNQLSIAGYSAQILAASASRLNARVPTGPVPGTVSVQALVNSRVSNILSFRYVAPRLPLLTRIIPPNAPTHSFIALQGSNLFGLSSSFEAAREDVSLTVTFPAVGGGTISVPILSSTPNQLIVQVPQNAASGNVIITSGGIQTSLPFTVNNNPISQPLPAGKDFQAMINSIKKPKDVAIDPTTQLALVVMSGTARVEAFALANVASTTPVASVGVGFEPARIALDPSRRLGFVSNSVSNSVTVLQLPEGVTISAKRENLYDARQMSVVKHIAVGRKPLGLAVDPGSGLLAVANNQDDSVTIIDLTTLTVRNTLPVGNKPDSLSFNTRAQTLYVANTGSEFVSVIDMKHMAVQPSLAVGPNMGALLFDPITEKLAIAAPESNFVILMDTKSGKKQITTVGAGPLDLALNLTRHSLLVLNKGSESLSEVDLAAGEVLSEVPLGAVPIALDYDIVNNRGVVLHAKTIALPSLSWNLSPEQDMVSGFSCIRMPSQLTYPRLLSTSRGEMMGYALANLSSQSIAVTLTALTNEGTRLLGTSLTNPRSLTLGSQGQIALLPEEIFGTGIPSDGWIKVQTVTADLKGFFLTFDKEVRYLDGVAETGDLVQKGLLPAILAGDGSVTEVSLVNDTPVYANAAVTLVNSMGVQQGSTSLAVPAFGAARWRVGEVFPQARSDMYLLLDSILPLRVYEQFGNSGGLAALNAIKLSEGANSLVFPQFASGGAYSTTLSVVNLENEDRQIRVSALDDNGLVITRAGVTNPKDFTLLARGRLNVQMAQDMGLGGSAIVQGSLRVTCATGPILGFVSYGANRDTTSVVAQGQARTTMIFSHVAETENATPSYFTGVALLNTGTETALVQLIVFRPDGSVSGAWNGSIAPNGRIAKVLRELSGIGRSVMGQTGGYFKVQSTQPLFGLSIFGTSDLTALAAIPPQ